MKNLPISLEEIRQEVLQLSKAERAELIQDIIHCLINEGFAKCPVESDPEFLAEIQRRSDLIRTDPSQLRDWRKSVDECRESLRARAKNR